LYEDAENLNDSEEEPYVPSPPGSEVEDEEQEGSEEEEEPEEQQLGRTRRHFRMSKENSNQDLEAEILALPSDWRTRPFKGKEDVHRFNLLIRSEQMDQQAIFDAIKVANDVHYGGKQIKYL
jgi:hypothetical protein